MFIKDEIAWRKNKPECGCQNICSRRDTGIDITIKNRAEYRQVTSADKREPCFNLSSKKQCDIILLGWENIYSGLVLYIFTLWNTAHIDAVMSLFREVMPTVQCSISTVMHNQK